MNYNIRNKSILKVAGIAIFAAVLCVGCYDLGIEPSVKPPVITTFVDIRDGKTYKKEQIGDQIWMAENLNYAADGSVCYGEGQLPERSILGWGVREPGKDYLVYKTFTMKEICDMYGRLYDWNTAMNNESSSNADPSGVEGVCPVGWHLPSAAEWEKLINYVGEHAGTKLKSHEFHSTRNTPEGADLYNFSALPGGWGTHLFAGQRTDEIHYGDIGTSGQWWTSTETPSHSDEIYYMFMSDDTREHYGDVVEKRSADKHRYYSSVRCVHD
jgi:uncharacterized protein (TIGR02145 family)